MRTLLVSSSVLALVAGCRSLDSALEPDSMSAYVAHRPMSSTVQPFGSTADGRPASLFVLTNARGNTAQLTDFGATLVSLDLPDVGGARADVVLGFDSVSGYESSDNQYFGCTAGRVANRIAGGRFTLDGGAYTLATNNGPNHLHGGERGFGQRMWAAESFAASDRQGVRFSRRSTDGEEGYPGNLDVVVTYTWTDGDELWVDYEARTDRATPVNLTHHSYFNLGGAGSGSILEHELLVTASRFTPTDETLIPTGDLATVEGTPLDFREQTQIGARIATLDRDATLGYDHNFALDSGGGQLSLAARLRDPSSGRNLHIYTTEPGLQFYSGNFLNGQHGKGGIAYGHRGGLCLETQHFPDAPNQPKFPSVTLRPGEVYRHTTVHRFDTKWGSGIANAEESAP